MIGREDVIIPTQAAPGDAMALAVRAILRFWPLAVIENAETGEVIPRRTGLFPESLHEALVYQDDRAAAEWTAKGAVQELANTMIHVLTGEGMATLVVDDPEDLRLAALLEEIQQTLQMDIFNFGAEPGVAA